MSIKVIALALSLGFIVGLCSGWTVCRWHDEAGQLHTQQAMTKEVAHANADTGARTLAAATHIQAIQANGLALHDAIHAHPLQAPHPRGGDDHATAAPAAATRCTDPFADPRFRLLYDAGSTASPPPG